MSLAPLVALALALIADDPIKDLAGRLASENPAERHQAADALDRIGPSALPELRAALSRTEPARHRAIIDVMERIGSHRLLHATMLAIEPGGKTCEDLAAEWSRKSGFRLGLDAEEGKRFRETIVTLPPSPAMPFWEAVDRLSRAADLQILTNSHPSPVRDSPQIRFGHRESGPAPACVAGPYRLAIVRLRSHREVLQTRPPAAPTTREDFRIDLEIMAEPGLMIEGNGSVRLIEAVSDRGGGLRSPTLPSTVRIATPPRPWPAATPSRYRVSLPLELPDERSGTIARLRGDVPILAMIRTDEIGSTPLGVAGVKEFVVEDASTRIHTSPDLGRNYLLEYSPRPAARRDDDMATSGPRQKTLSIVKPPYNPVDSIQIEDDQGRNLAFNAYPVGAPAVDGRQDYRLFMGPNPGLGAPARLRYHGVAAVAIEVPFDFRDLPIP